MPSNPKSLRINAPRTLEVEEVDIGEISSGSIRDSALSRPYYTPLKTPNFSETDLHSPTSPGRREGYVNPRSPTSPTRRVSKSKSFPSGGHRLKKSEIDVFKLDPAVLQKIRRWIIGIVTGKLSVG
jgi:hypothetical protein